jgi:type II secretory pathway predicted ATPase ExeA
VTEDDRLADWRRRAFPASADPALFWAGGGHGDALASLQGAVAHGDRVAVLTGDTGTGKSIVLSVLAEALRADGTVVGVLPCVGVDDAVGFRAACAHAFGVAVSDGVYRAELEAELARIVTAATRRGARAVLLIDEAQSLPADCHAEIAWLLEALDGLAVILAGDDDVVRVARTAIGPLYATATAVTRLRQWTASEVAAYIAHALRGAGGSAPAFGADVAAEVWAGSGGTPRLVNAICREALRISADPDAHAIRRCGEAVRGPEEHSAGAISTPSELPSELPVTPFELSLPPRRRRLTPARIAVGVCAVAILATSAAVVSTSSVSDRGLNRGPEIRPRPATATASLAAVVTPVVAPATPGLDSPVSREPGSSASGRSSPEIMVPTSPAVPPVVPAQPPAVRPTPHAALTAPRPSVKSPRPPPRRAPTAVNVARAPEGEPAGRDGEPIIDWLLDEYARNSARRSD